MDDDWKEYKRNKPQQKLYKPGSGPLRRSCYGLDSKMNSFEATNGPRGRDQNHFGSKNSIYEDDISSNNKDYAGSRQKKPEQQLYVPRNADCKAENERYSNTSMRPDNTNHSYSRRNSNSRTDKYVYNNSTGYPRGNPSRRDRSFVHNKEVTNNDNYNRNNRQVSEPRSISPSHRIKEPSTPDRNRDTRSMETSAGRHNLGSGGKPPSGRRNSAGYPSDSQRHKYMLNLENLPPRLKKKFLEQSGHHTFESAEHLNRDRSSNNSVESGPNQGSHLSQTASWSQTLPSRGRGRLRDNEGFDREKFITTYLKNYEVQQSRQSTPSSSYINLYEPNSIDNRVLTQPAEEYHNNHNKELQDPESKNGISNHKNEDQTKQESDSEPASCSSTNLMDLAILDWSEEVEKYMKLDDMCDSAASSPSLNVKSSSMSQDPRVTQVETKTETRESKRSGRSKRRDKRSSSRGNKNEKKNDRNIKDDIQHESIAPIPNIKPKERERRDSHRSNRSSNIGNSRDDLDRWRSLRSFSREQSTEGRIVSQCNSRDTSANRALSPRDNDGFRIPSAIPKNASWNSTNQKKNNGSAWSSGRTPSAERHASHAAHSSQAAAREGGNTEGPARRSRRRSGRARRSRAAEPAAPPAPHPHPHPTTSLPHNYNWREEIIESKKHTLQDRLDRHQEVNRNRLNSTHSEKSESSSSAHPGLLILPQSSISHLQKDQIRESSTEAQKMLYDHHNPSKPIIVQTNSSKMDTRMSRAEACSEWSRVSPERAEAGAGAEAGARAARHRPLLQEVDRADAILQTHTLAGAVALAAHWTDVMDTRKFLQGALQKLLMSDLKYCQSDNIEHHFWKILYYHFIEVLRKSLQTTQAEDKAKIVKLINTIIEEGTSFFESLIQMLEKTYKFNIEDYINDNHLLPPKGMGYTGLALISVQKLYIFLGDLSRYKEQVNESNNYAKSKFWYTKAQQINPKNGRPYNQLAILAIYARRKLDAVYYYMRSLMSSNPFHSARESLISLFDENRKKYEAAERKRRALLEANKEPSPRAEPSGRGLRREVWLRPGGGRTTRLRHHSQRDDRLANMTPVELNKNFITSYLYVHGKLVTKIGMETFHESATQMLRQFRALLNQQPLPTPAARLLQLTALNMFAVESTVGNKDSEPGRSAWLECALGVSLLMFGAMVERCCALLPEPANTQQHADALLLLPAIKVWSDWMLCHSSVWNPPPSFDSFDIGTEKDPWDWLAKLMNILESLDDKTIVFETEMKEGYTPVRLSEDSTLAGFTPLMYMEVSGSYMRRAAAAPPPHIAEHALRTKNLLFFGTEYLVGVEPPVLGLEYPAQAPPRYVSVVTRNTAQHHALHHLSEDSEEDEVEEVKEAVPEVAASEATEGEARQAGRGEGGGAGRGSEGAEGADEDTKRLLRRKEQLEERRDNMERRQKRMQEVLQGGWVTVEVEVRPRWLVPDTNCFIEHLPLLKQVLAAAGQPYLLAVPIVVVTELEGLSRCARVGPRAAAALAWLGAGGGGAGAGGAGAGGAGAGGDGDMSGVRYATSRGSLLHSRAFTAERERDNQRETNDDRVLATATNLHANIATVPDVKADDGSNCVKRVREVVLLTDDRNLRVKAIAADLPARDLPSFVEWAAIEVDAKVQPANENNGKTDGH